MLLKEFPSESGGGVAMSFKLSRENVESLQYRDILHHNTLRNADGTPLRCRVNGKVKLWKTSSEVWFEGMFLHY